MEDLERYGDYTEYEDDIPKGKKNPVIRILKILVAVICISVIGIFAFRLIVFNYYPDSMSDIYFTENLKEYYYETDGNIGAITQDLRAPYDDPDVASFFCDNLIVIRGAGEIQLSVRYNSSSINTIQEKLKLEKLDPESEKIFTFRLEDNWGRVYDASYVGRDSFMMYNYFKLAFDKIPFDDEEKPVEWMRLQVFVEGQKDDKAHFLVAVYEDNSVYSKFDEYELSSEEKPQ